MKLKLLFVVWSTNFAYVHIIYVGSGYLLIIHEELK
jgi:hypothetical protein